MKILSLITCCFVVLILSSCTQSKFYIAEGFISVDPKAALIITDVNEIDISQNYELFTLDNLKRVRNSFFELQRELLPLEISKIASFNSVTASLYQTSPQFEKKEFIVNKNEKVELMVPKSSIKYESEGNYYVLFFQDYKIGFELEETDSSDPARTVSAEKIPGLDPQLKLNKLYKPLFVIRTKYYIYDNNNANVLLAGNVIIKELYTLEMNLEKVLLESIKGLAKRIISKTPLEK
ncbi:MAG: hypothetical protein AB1432_12185 [Bacteroidota bacterium]|jgi:hypothetical protein